MKTLKCETSEGACVVKIYTKHGAVGRDIIKVYSDLLSRAACRLRRQPNVLAYARFVEGGTSVCVVRQYFRYTLRSRLSSRPFLTPLEKRWAAFLLLHSLRQSHERNVVHGDIKSENVVCTSWGWYLLTDFACFKPLNLPGNDPAAFHFFFESRGRRRCYLAPERFHYDPGRCTDGSCSTAHRPGSQGARPAQEDTSTDIGDGGMPPGAPPSPLTGQVLDAMMDRMLTPADADEGIASSVSRKFCDVLGDLGPDSVAACATLRPPTLTRAMDVFSMGCVIAELFLDGEALFGLSDMLKYSKETRRGVSVNDTFPSYFKTHDGKNDLSAADMEDSVEHKCRRATPAGLHNISTPLPVPMKGLVGVAAALAKLAVADNRVYDLVVHMLQRDPRRRRRASEYLSCHTQISGKGVDTEKHGRIAESLLFPSYFSSFLFGFLSSMLNGPRSSPDDRVKAICAHYGVILHQLADGARDPAGETLFRQRLRLMGMFSMGVSGSTKKHPPRPACCKSVARCPSTSDFTPCNAPANEEALVADVDALVEDLFSDQVVHLKPLFPPKAMAFSCLACNDLGQHKVSELSAAGATWASGLFITPEAGSFAFKKNKVVYTKKTSIGLLNKRMLGAAGTSCAVVGVAGGDGNGLVIIIGLLCETLRLVRSPQIKLTALWLMARFAELGGGDEVRLQRVVPILVSLLSDSSTAVRAEAVRALSRMLRLVQSFSPSDFNVFSEYIFAAVQRIPSDPDEVARLAFAECIPLLAETSGEYLERKLLSSLHHRHSEAKHRRRLRRPRRRNDRNNHVDRHHREGFCQRDRWQYRRRQVMFERRRENELRVLREEIEKALARMVARVPVSSSLAKRTLLCGVARLCTFFGRDRTNDFLLPLLITFLNEHGDGQLRATFFERISGVGLFVGKVPLQQFLLPCIEHQALQDPEDIVVERALRCLASLCQLGLLGNAHTLDLAGKVSPLLYHPGAWIRRGTVQYLTAVASCRPKHPYVSYADTQSLLVPVLMPFFYSLGPGVHRDLLLVGLTERRRFSQHFSDYDVGIHSGPVFSSGLNAMVLHPLKSPLTRGQFGLSICNAGVFDVAVGGKSQNRMSERSAVMCSYTPIVDGRHGITPKLKIHNEPHNCSTLHGSAVSRLDSTIGDDGIMKIIQIDKCMGRGGVVSCGHLEKRRERLGKMLRCSGVGVTGEETEAECGWLLAELGDLHFGSTSELICSIAGYRDIFVELCALFRSGHAVRDRVYHGNEYLSCFVGSEVVDVLLKQGAVHTARGAVALGNLLVDVGAVTGVAGAHAFKNGFFYFRFSGAVSVTRTASLMPQNKALFYHHLHLVSVPHQNQYHAPATTIGGPVSLLKAGHMVEELSSSSLRHVARDPCGDGDILQGARSKLVFGHVSAIGFSATNPLNGLDIVNTKSMSIETARAAMSSATNGPMAPRSERMSSGALRDVTLTMTRQFSGTIWRPRGVLMTQLFEHTGAVVAIAVSCDNAWFATGANDGAVKVWKGNGLDREVAVASQNTISPDDAPPIGDLAVCANDHSIAVGYADGNVHVVQVDRCNSPFDHSRRMFPPGDGIVAVSYLNSVTRALLCCASQHGRVRGWDLRARRLALGLSVPPCVGEITSMAVGVDTQWLVCGTSRGFLALFDVRFPLLVRLWRHGSHARVHSVKTTCLYPSKPVAYVTTAAGNECNLWNLETGRCERVYRSLPPSCSQAVALLCPHLEFLPNFPRFYDTFRRGRVCGYNPAFNCWPYGMPNMNPPTNEPTMRAILCPMSEPQLFTGGSPGSSLISAGSDCHIRFWDVERPRKSYTLSGLETNQSLPSYDLAHARVWSAARRVSVGDVSNKLVRRSRWRKPNELCLCQDALLQIQEKRPSKGSGGPSACTNHAGTITALGGISLPSMRLLISGDQDGVVKVWR